ncbi:PREDICTED: exocyst complex component 8-like isoform X1 [Branchiostoma belcheri]|uniref:Exocyst complex component 8 n=1 Tax=Branchiostoma belcheri TaxID=7741 RepID=A0A6P5A7I0_BRABE|nr:PREDICTED: exocyst complex component 8-like isoform X1 [Branchiostoma belcheri]
MAEGLKRTLGKPGFDPEDYAREIAQKSDGDRDLLEHRQRVQNLQDDTSLALKKNVYQNYMQFIETAKEISYVESEMYQLSHILTDQKTIMNSMMQMSITDKEEAPKEKETPKEKEDKKKNLSTLLEKVEGCSHVTEVPGRYLVHSGGLVELDPDSHTQIQRVHTFLMNDSLMVASWIASRRGPVHYKFQALYELDSLAVVNIRDAGPMKNSFKVLMFPDCRVFQAESPKAKREWLDSLDQAKKSKAAADSQKKEAQVKDDSAGDSFDRSNPFADNDEEDQDLPLPPHIKRWIAQSAEEMLRVDWIQELPEDLDVCIAQRDFEGAVDLIDKCNEYLEEVPQSPALKEYRARVDQRIKHLTEVLQHELQGLQGGPKAARRAVLQLIKLGKSTQACDLFLRNRTMAIKRSLRQLKMEGSTTLYVNKLCYVFFTTMLEVGREFQKDFSSNNGCCSAFVVWAKLELETFVGMFARQVFSSKTSLSMVAECVEMAQQYCDKLCEIGLDLTFALHSLLVKDVRRAMHDGRDQIVEAIRHRSMEEKWRAYNLQTPQACRTVVKEMEDLGLSNFKSLMYDDCWIKLTPNMVNYTKQLLQFLDQCLKLYQPELHMVLVENVMMIIRCVGKQMETALTAKEYTKNHPFILRNSSFVFETVVQRIERRFQEHVGKPAKQFQELKTDYAKLRSLARTPTTEL